MSIEFLHEAARSRYAILEEGETVGTLTYTTRGDIVSLTYSYTEPEHRGRGLAAQLVEFAVEDITADPEARIIPTCGYVRGWFADHPEYRDALFSNL